MLTTQIAKEKEMEVNDSQQEQEWFKQGKKSYIETKKYVEHLDHIIKII
jgi:hypothetical protein